MFGAGGPRAPRRAGHARRVLAVAHGVGPRPSGRPVSTSDNHAPTGPNWLCLIFLTPWPSPDGSRKLALFLGRTPCSGPRTARLALFVARASRLWQGPSFPRGGFISGFELRISGLPASPSRAELALFDATARGTAFLARRCPEPSRMGHEARQGLGRYCRGLLCALGGAGERSP